MKLNSYTVFGRKFVASILEKYRLQYPTEQFRKTGTAKELVFITPHTPSNTDGRWNEIHKAWREIVSSETRALHSWRVLMKYGEQVVLGSRLFFLKDSPSCLFYLLKEENHVDAVSHFFDCWGVLSALKHAHSGHLILHGAGVVKEKNAFIFLGRSGAGKSTASRNSLHRGYTVIHDDHVVVSKSNDGGYVVTDSTFSLPLHPLKAFFFLVQDTSDFLVPFSGTETVKKLINGCRESVAAPLLHGKYLKHSFNFTVAMSRVVPGYQLHLRNHPAFWDVIEAEFES